MSLAVAVHSRARAIELTLILAFAGCSEAPTSRPEADTHPFAKIVSATGDQPTKTSADKASRSVAYIGDIEADSSDKASPSEVTATKPVRVTGVVKYRGKPITGAQVAFHGTYTATAITDEKGKFSLTTFEPHDGALPGEYVVVLKADGLPNVYAQKETSNLKRTVRKPNAPNDFEFLFKE